MNYAMLVFCMHGVKIDYIQNVLKQIRLGSIDVMNSSVASDYLYTNYLYQNSKIEYILLALVACFYNKPQRFVGI